MLLEEKELNGGIQKIYRFKNGYGASVVRHMYSYGFSQGLWELAVIKWKDNGDWDICYFTTVTNDVEGYLTDQQVEDLLNKIKSIKKWSVWWNRNFSMREGYPASKLKSFWENVKDYYYDRVLSKFR